ncbi:PQQ-dependent sugar dehydrogenase [Actinocorallia sp. API 0066]|uniref:PQQ-dependent sugar dehydrogenase n=1 Tax=Actinocorallia sp. API 0066 TaxID=2896846 RepID=UPI001E605F17|nr:PQQ-dependent sugar dehydrogenase [Actinocorallia sp. API 0066]MCD0451423.1 PQQ-dependent sugar dehydrogenase [Actinocorallia sp. API 0066]
MRVRIWFSSALTVVFAAGCAADTSPSAADPTPAAPAPSAEPSPSGSKPAARLGKVKLADVAELAQPVGMAVRKGDDALYVIEQEGKVKSVKGGQTDDVLDVTALTGSGGERGLLGIAFSPDGKRLYLYHTAKDGTIILAEYPVTAEGSVDASGRREVLRQAHPRSNHNGGQLAFGPDGHLYLGLGDGGGAGDPDRAGQDLGTWLGKILRIDPKASGGKPYTVPKDNPFVGEAGAKPEIWAYGLRNPWRFSFDAETGDLWIGDVGQDKWEEVNFQPGDSRGGENYGWSAREGSHPFRSDKPVGVNPVHEYPLRENGQCSVIGGHVYRGSAVPGLAGRYVFADFCAGWIKAFTRGGGAPVTLLRNVNSVSALGVDGAGELYVLSLNGTLQKLVPA